MDGFKDVFGLYWWFSVVFVGLIINLVSAYVKSPLDKYAARHWARWRELTKRRREEYDAQVESLSYEPQRQTFLCTQECSYRLKAIQGFLFALLFIGFGLVVSRRASNYDTSWWIGLGFAVWGMIAVAAAGLASSKAVALAALIGEASLRNQARHARTNE